jgi:hypothetical protein
MWKNIVDWDRPQMTIWRMYIACWVLKATNTQSEYVILTAFPLQHYLYKRSSQLRYTYIVSAVFSQDTTVLARTRANYLRMPLQPCAQQTWSFVLVPDCAKSAL